MTNPTNPAIPSSPQFQIIGEPALTEGKIVTVQIKAHDRYYTLTVDFKKPIAPEEREKFLKSAETKSKIEEMVKQRVIFTDIYSNRPVPKEFEIITHSNKSDVFIRTKDKTGNFKDEVTVGEKIDKWRTKSRVVPDAHDAAAQAKFDKAKGKIEKYTAAKEHTTELFSKAVTKAEEVEKEAALKADLDQAEIKLGAPDIIPLRKRAEQLLDDPKINSGYMPDRAVETNLGKLKEGHWLVCSQLEEKTGISTPCIFIKVNEDEIETIELKDVFESTESLEALISLLDPEKGSEEEVHEFRGYHFTPEKVVNAGSQDTVGVLTKKQAELILMKAGKRNAGIRYHDFTGARKVVYTKGANPAKVTMLDRNAVLHNLTLLKFEEWGNMTEEQVARDIKDAPANSYMVWRLPGRLFGSTCYCTVKNGQGRISTTEVKDPEEACRDYGKTENGGDRELWTPKKAWNKLKFDVFESEEELELYKNEMNPGEWMIFTLADQPDDFKILYMADGRILKVVPTLDTNPSVWQINAQGEIKLDPAKMFKPEDRQDEEISSEDSDSASVDSDEEYRSAEAE